MDSFSSVLFIYFSFNKPKVAYKLYDDTHFTARKRNLVVLDEVWHLSDHVVEVFEEGTLLGVGHFDISYLL